jgi:hypothetical protein
MVFRYDGELLSVVAHYNLDQAALDAYQKKSGRCNQTTQRLRAKRSWNAKSFTFPMSNRSQGTLSPQLTEPPWAFVPISGCRCCVTAIPSHSTKFATAGGCRIWACSHTRSARTRAPTHIGDKAKPLSLAISYHNDGNALIAQGKLDEALKAYRESLAPRQPRDPRAAGRHRSQQYAVAARVGCKLHEACIGLSIKRNANVEAHRRQDKWDRQRRQAESD